MDTIPDITTEHATAMPDILITTEGVRKSLLQLNPSKVAGPDAGPVGILKMCASQLAPVLADFYQQSLNEGRLPEKLKMANVAPIYKKRK